MFLHIGGDVVVLKKDVIAIFDIYTKLSPVTREFIEVAKDEGFIKNISGQSKEKAYVITTREVFMSPISCATLKKRSEKIFEY